MYLRIKQTLSLSIIFSIFLLSSTVLAEPLKIRFSHNHSVDTPKFLMVNHFQKLVKERLGDEKVVIEVYPGSQLFNDFEITDAILQGKVELGIPSISKMMKISPRLKLFDLPFLFTSTEAADKFIKGKFGERLLRLVQRQGFLALGILNNGMKQLTLNKTATLPADIEAMTFRIKNSDVLESQFELLKARTVRKPLADVYKLLADKEVDGQENTWSNIYSKKFYEHQPNIIESNHGYQGYMIITNPNFWNNLPNPIRIVLEQALKESIEYGNDIATKRSFSSKEKIVASGLTEVKVLAIAERKVWVDTMRPIWSKYENLIGTDLINAAAASN